MISGTYLISGSVPSSASTPKASHWIRSHDRSPRSPPTGTRRELLAETRKEDRMYIMPGIHLSRIRVAAIAVVLAVAGLLVSASLIAPARAATAHAASGAGPKPAIVLEHGAWADGSSWDAVIGLLQADGYTVYAPPDPLRGLANDSATLADFLETIAGRSSWWGIP